MRKLSALLVSLALLPCTTAFAMPINSYFQQGLTVNNGTSQPILVTDRTVPSALNNYKVETGYKLKGEYASDKFTNPAGQTFSHVIDIYSARTNQKICTVTSYLTITTTSVTQKHPTSSDEAKCSTSVYLSSGSAGMIYGFNINVN
jgi:hypothetical protein